MFYFTTTLKHLIPTNKSRISSIVRYYATAKDNYYDILKVPKHADRARIKSSFYKLSMKYHPDLNPDNEVAHKEFLKLSEAYSVLSNGEKRKDYDRLLFDKTPFSKEKAFSNRFRNRNTKPVKQYSNAKFNANHQFKNASNQYGNEEYVKQHYPEFNQPFRFNSEYKVDDRPKIESSSDIWGRMLAVMIMMSSCYFVVNTLGNEKENKRKL